jgi:hypothetical protein
MVLLLYRAEYLDNSLIKSANITCLFGKYDNNKNMTAMNKKIFVLGAK